MPSDPDLSELLLHWDEARQQGRPISPEELCAPHPELLPELKRRIVAVEAMERRLGMGDATVDSGPSGLAGQAAENNGARPPENPRIPGYEVLGLLGQGGMGVVYKARQVQLKRLVALKMIRAETHTRHLARFRVEAEAVARLQHPNIVQIYDIGESEGRPYFSMEFIEGGSLAQQIAGRPLPPRQAAALVATLADAVHFAHQRGVVHRDLKPANVLVNDGVLSGGVMNGGTETTQAPVITYHSHTTTTHHSPLTTHHIKITDFGLAKRLDGDSALSAVAGQTQSGVILGTPCYMAPEQASGKTRDVGTPADVYALGAILYETLTGRPPFRGETPMETLLQVMSSDPVPPSREQRQVPRDLETICLKCLEKSPGRRYASAAALASDLRRFLDGQPIAARPISLPRRVVKWARRRPETAALIALLLCAVLGVAGRAAWVYYRDQEEARLAEQRRAEQARLTAVELAPRARQILRQYCYDCHGLDPKFIEGKKLDVLNHALLLDPKRSLVVPYDVVASRLIHRIEDNSMPPEEEEEFPRMASDEIEVLKKWVAGGAPPFAEPGPDDRLPPRPTKLAIEVKAIFSEKCHECHRIGFAKNGIKILNHDLLVAKRKVVVPGDPGQSVLYQSLLSKDPKKVMPPPDHGELLPEEITTIRRWILEGAGPFPREHKARTEPK
jgi:serine/threonine protein kinase/mono/diheme cytochrome c family protein